MQVRHSIESLKQGAKYCECCHHIQSIDALSLSTLLTRLAYERLERKAFDDEVIDSKR